MTEFAALYYTQLRHAIVLEQAGKLGRLTTYGTGKPVRAVAMYKSYVLNGGWVDFNSWYKAAVNYFKNETQSDLISDTVIIFNLKYGIDTYSIEVDMNSQRRWNHMLRDAALSLFRTPRALVDIIHEKTGLDIESVSFEQALKHPTFVVKQRAAAQLYQLPKPVHDYGAYAGAIKLVLAKAGVRLLEQFGSRPRNEIIASAPEAFAGVFNTQLQHWNYPFTLNQAVDQLAYRAGVNRSLFIRFLAARTASLLENFVAKSNLLQSLANNVLTAEQYSLLKSDWNTHVRDSLHVPAGLLPNERLTIAPKSIQQPIDVTYDEYLLEKMQRAQNRKRKVRTPAPTADSTASSSSSTTGGALPSGTLKVAKLSEQSSPSATKVDEPPFVVPDTPADVTMSESPPRPVPTTSQPPALISNDSANSTDTTVVVTPSGESGDEMDIEGRAGSRGTLSATKAKQILEDARRTGTVRGNPITDKQRRFLYHVAHGNTSAANISGTAGDNIIAVTAPLTEPGLAYGYVADADGDSDFEPDGIELADFDSDDIDDSEDDGESEDGSADENVATSIDNGVLVGGQAKAGKKRKTKKQKKPKKQRPPVAKTKTRKAEIARARTARRDKRASKKAKLAKLSTDEQKAAKAAKKKKHAARKAAMSPRTYEKYRTGKKTRPAKERKEYKKKLASPGYEAKRKATKAKHADLKKRMGTEKYAKYRARKSAMTTAEWKAYKDRKQKKLEKRSKLSPSELAEKKARRAKKKAAYTPEKWSKRQAKKAQLMGVNKDLWKEYKKQKAHKLAEKQYVAKEFPPVYRQRYEQDRKEQQAQKQRLARTAKKKRSLKSRVADVVRTVPTASGSSLPMSTTQVTVIAPQGSAPPSPAPAPAPQMQPATSSSELAVLQQQQQLLQERQLREQLQIERLEEQQRQLQQPASPPSVAPPPPAQQGPPLEKAMPATSSPLDKLYRLEEVAQPPQYRLVETTPGTGTPPKSVPEKPEDTPVSISGTPSTIATLLTMLPDPRFKELPEAWHKIAGQLYQYAFLSTDVAVAELSGIKPRIFLSPGIAMENDAKFIITIPVSKGSPESRALSGDLWSLAFPRISVNNGELVQRGYDVYETANATFVVHRNDLATI